MSLAESQTQRRAPRAWARWLAFGLWAAAILAVAPFANEVQEWIRLRLGPRALRYALIALLLALTPALAAWLIRRPRKVEASQLLWLVAVATAALAILWRLEVEAEPAHLASYGVLGFLAFRALSVRLRDAGVFLAAAALTALVGTVDEIVQWWLPRRYWGLGDVGLNAAAGALVQALIWKGLRPEGIAPGVSARSLRAAARLTGAWALLLALCLANTPERIEWYAARVPGLDRLGKDRATLMAEYGHLYVDPEIGRFTSRFAPDELRRVDRERGAEAGKVLERFRKPESYGGLQRLYRPAVDPLVYEAGGHLYYRESLSAWLAEEPDPARRRRLGDVAWRENLILERYFPHTLASSGLALDGARRQRLEELRLPGAELESEVSDWVITAFSETRGLWTLAALLAVLGWTERVCSRRLAA